MTDWASLEPRERIKAIVHHYSGCSVLHRKDELARLIGKDFAETPEADCDPDRGSQSVLWRTNCATFALAVLAAAHLSAANARAKHELLARPLSIGTGFTWLVTVGQQCGDIVAYRRTGEQPKTGDILWYRHAKNDDHAEVCLSDVGDDFVVLHGGGGRSNNAITVGRGDVRWSVGRPLHAFISVDRMKMPASLARPPSAEEVSWMTDLQAEQERLNAVTAKHDAIADGIWDRPVLEPPEE